MSLLRLMLCLTLLAPSLGFAQGSEEWTPYTPPAPVQETPPPLVPAPSPPEASPTPPPPAPAPAQGELIPRLLSPEATAGTPAALRLVVTPWAGVVAGMMGLIAGAVPTALIALPLCLGVDDFEDEPRCAIPVVAGLSVSYSLGATFGIIFMSKALGGQGDTVMTGLGALAGMAAGAGIGVASQNTAVFFLSLALGPLFGALIGYEVSNAQAIKPAEPALQTRAGLHVMPVVGATPRGGVMGGLAGRF